MTTAPIAPISRQPLSRQVETAKRWYEDKTGRLPTAAGMGRILSILLFAEKHGVEDLWQECELHVGTATRWAGPPTTPGPGGSPDKTRKGSDETYRRALALHAKKHSQAEIANRLGVSRQRIFAILKDAGVWERGEAATRKPVWEVERIGGSSQEDGIVGSSRYLFIYLKKVRK